ncbi:MAG: DEAD/DEAH box helicase family protein [Calditrichaeota bacterium]|nr:DEAD/DEAH box helicase family protein [Calditrichota bacterium]
MARVDQYITARAVEKIRRAIQEAGGNEVYFVGYTDKDLRIVDVDVLARGNPFEVPAILQTVSEGDVVIHNHPSGDLTPSSADVNILSKLAGEGVAGYIVNNDVTDIYVVVEPIKPKEIQPLDEDELVRILSPLGPIARKLSNYEHRPQQEEMLRVVTRAFNQNELAVIEAGTGTGKTLAYLLPAIHWALKNKERCLVSTNTINLQEQLVYKDIPFLQSVLPEKFNAVLVKGRGNYVCLRKVDELQLDLDLYVEEEEKDELQKILDWVKVTSDGSKSDLGFVPSNEIWEKVASESETCTRARCRFFNKCFVMRARREAAKAHVLVVNHHLLFADLALREITGDIASVAVLPPYQRIVLDEAHHIEDVATNYFGIGITRWGMSRLLHRLHRLRKGIPRGLVHVVAERLRAAQGKVPRHKLDKLERILTMDLLPAVQEAESLNEEVMEDLYQTTVQVSLQLPRREENNSEAAKIRLTELVLSMYQAQPVLWEGLKKYEAKLRSLSLLIADLVDGLTELESAVPSLASPRIEIAALGERFAAAAETLRVVFQDSGDEWIRWVEIKPRPNRNIVRVGASPLEIGPRLAEAVFKSYKTVVMTSATLAVDRKFDFFKERVGLSLVPGDRVVEELLPAPFNYREQVIIGVPLDVPEPSHPRFAEELVPLLWEALQVTRGRAFVLFTSYSLLSRMYNRLASLLRDAGMEPLRQGMAQRHKLLEWFKRDTHSVLFATDSFWEGVDVEGEALSSVIITRLPFKVPTEPVVEARVEAIARRGGNPFTEYTVPQAVLKFKQGFGRLIRRKTDRGCVLIFDKRIVEKSYGRVFLNSLPETRFVSGPRQEVFQAVEAFFTQAREPSDGAGPEISDLRERESATSPRPRG